ncbi:CDP-glucose 4,6-dehydratase [Aurantiacibacter poecillastricola]|uniref:CDP-glucose 4,6-dehydratase n=1 Tax=Aurantiacibacter poecillastricola TaxID=3064385 RepID=UPI00273D8FEB|nr:CDP-glucose 4,6-dehydratase [Aurantiacibacter sp. 219JJ12-13]MDP5262416.1 CDP-glucose 4,6-dehydratase [Aurantiacibacter sp. 219JJ12-13]
MREASSLDDRLRSAFAGRKVLLTGHTGFKGGWMALWLTMLGAEVRGIALSPETEPSLFDALGLSELIDHRIADIRDEKALGEAVAGFEADIVFHLAAQSLVRPSYEDPVGTLSTNVIGTATVLEQVRRMPSAKAVVVVSSDKCYENNEWPWPYREVDPMGGADPYSASKGCTELVASSYRRSFFADPEGCQLASVRAGNVFGGGDWSRDRLVPDIVRANLSGTPVIIRNPEGVRPWQHVLEPLSGYMELGALLLSDRSTDFAEGWNFGPSADAFVRVKDLARGMQQAWGEAAAPIEFGSNAGDPPEANMLTLDSSKAAQRIGWRPRLTTDEAIAMTAQWYLAHAEGQRDMRQFTQQQIAQYCGMPADAAAQAEYDRQCA